VSSKIEVIFIVRHSMKMYEEVKDSSTHSLSRHDVEAIVQFDALPFRSRASLPTSPVLKVL
jgi:hypothetical protein